MALLDDASGGGQQQAGYYGGQYSGSGVTNTAAPQTNDIREKVLSNGDIVVQQWDGYSWVTIGIRSPADTDSGGGGGASAPAYASTAEGIAAQQAWEAEQERQRQAYQAEQDRLQREWEAAQEAKRLEEQRRQGLLSTANAMLQGRRESRDVALQRASDLAGSDIFRFLANVKGKQVAAGTQTPMDIFKAQNAQIATAQLPGITGNETIGDLESAITKMQAQQDQESNIGVGPFTGFAYGGSMGPPMMAAYHMMPDGSMMPNSTMNRRGGMMMGMADGGSMGPPMSMGQNMVGGGPRFGTTKDAVLVGDKMMNGDEEVLIRDRATGSVEVIPLSGRAQTGAEWKPEEASLTVLPQLFSTLRNDIGVGSGLLAPGQSFASPGSEGGVEFLRRQRTALGYGPVWQGWQGGEARLGEGGALATPLNIKQGLIDTTRYTPEQADQLANLIGILPAPHKAARFFRNLLPAEKQAIISAYRMAGFPEADLNQIVSESAIAGPQRVGVSVR